MSSSNKSFGCFYFLKENFLQQVGAGHYSWNGAGECVGKNGGVFVLGEREPDQKERATQIVWNDISFYENTISFYFSFSKSRQTIDANNIEALSKIPRVCSG